MPAPRGSDPRYGGLNSEFFRALAEFAQGEEGQRRDGLESIESDDPAADAARGEGEIRGSDGPAPRRASQPKAQYQTNPNSEFSPENPEFPRVTGVIGVGGEPASGTVTAAQPPSSGV